MTFAVELLIGRSVADDFDQRAEVEQTRLRYELTISRRPDAGGTLRPFVEHEAITPIAKAKDPYFASSSESFRQHRLRYEGSRWKMLTTEERKG